MYHIGIHHLVWHADVGDRTGDLLPVIAGMGFDGIEVPIFAPEHLDTRSLQAAIEGAGLLCTASTALPPGLSLIDEPVRAEGIRWLQRVVTSAAELGATILCGPMVLPVGELRGRGYTSAEFAMAVDSFREVARVAADHGVTIALEPLNRFETFFLNTVADGVRLADAVDNPAFGLLLDTFHMHIEEKSTVAAIQEAAQYIKHFHCSENDRGIVGSGQVAWREVLSALVRTGYKGWLVVESFGAAMPELAAATCMWRPPAASPEVLARESGRFIRQQLAVMD